MRPLNWSILLLFLFLLGVVAWTALNPPFDENELHPPNVVLPRHSLTLPPQSWGGSLFHIATNGRAAYIEALCHR